MMKRLSVVFLFIFLTVACSGSDSTFTSDQSDTVDTPPQLRYAGRRVSMGNQIGAEPATLDENGKRRVDALNYYFNGNAEVFSTAQEPYALYPRNAGTLLGWCDRAKPLDETWGVRPLIIYYSTKSGSEGDIAGFKKEVDDENLPKYYITLGLLASYYRFAIDEGKTKARAASILINPDLLGYITQQGWLDSPAFLKDLIINVNRALTAAACVLSSQNFGESESMRLDDLWENLWGNESGFNEAVTPVVKACLENPETSVDIPGFSEDFKGYTLGMNWLVETYGNPKKMAYGWHMNISAPPVGGKWLFNDLGEDAIESTFTTPVLKALQDTAYSDPDWMPDFLAFDKYGADDTQVKNLGAANTNYPYFYNARDWDNYLAGVKQTSEGLNKMPIVLWQIAGGHIQDDGGAYTNADHISSFSTYLFGDQNLNEDLSNAINLSDVTLDAYHNCTTGCDAVSYLRMNDYNWKTSDRMAAVIAANVYAIHWQSYTYPTVGIYANPFSSECNDGGWLSEKVKAYASK
jgi:hypothetical protein